MLYMYKDLASKCFDWRGVGRGAEWRHPNVSNRQNRRSRRDFRSPLSASTSRSFALLRISAAGSRFAHAR